MEFESNSNQFEESIMKLECLLEKIQEHKLDEEHILKFFGGDIIDIDGQFIIMEHQQLTNYKKEIQKIKQDLQKMQESLLKSKQYKSFIEENQYLKIQVDTFQNQVQKLQKQIQSDSEIRLKMDLNFKTIQTLQRDNEKQNNQNNLLTLEIQTLKKQNNILLEEKTSMDKFLFNKQEPPYESINQIQYEDLHSTIQQLQTQLSNYEQDHQIKLKNIQKFAEFQLQDIKDNLRDNRFQEEWFRDIFSSEQDKIYKIIKITKEKNNLQDRLASKMHDMIEERENFFKEKKELQNQIEYLKQFRENLSDSINHINQQVDLNLSQANDGIFNIEQYESQIQNLQKQIKDMALEISDLNQIVVQYQNQIILNQQKYEEIIKEQSKQMESIKQQSVNMTEYQKLENQYTELEKKNQNNNSIMQQQKKDFITMQKQFEDQLLILKEENDLLKGFQIESQQNYLEKLKEHYRNKYKEQYEENYKLNQKLQKLIIQHQDLNLQYQQAQKNYQELKSLKFENQITYDGVIQLVKQLDELKIINNMLKKDKNMLQKIYEQNSEQSFNTDLQSIEDEDHIISGVNEYCDKLKMYEQYTQLDNYDDVNKALNISTRLLQNIKNNLN